MRYMLDVVTTSNCKNYLLSIQSVSERYFAMYGYVYSFFVNSWEIIIAYNMKGIFINFEIPTIQISLFESLIKRSVYLLIGEKKKT